MREQGNYNPILVIGGLVGSLFSTLCCIGIAPLIALVTTIGLGFMLTLSILLPLLVAFLILGCLGMVVSYRRHGVAYPALLHCAAGIFLAILISIQFHTGPWIWIAMGSLTVATLWNIRLEYTYWHREPEVQFPPAG
jgi:hypothetical protein